MKILNRDRAVIEPRKLINYLLDPEHNRGGSKATLLIQFGYSQENWQQLERDLYDFHLSSDVDIVKETRYGLRYEISAALPIPIGRSLLVRTVWQIDKGTDFPRLITLIPD
jgi:hypothetical protein